MKLFVVGMNHQTAPISIREACAFSEEEIEKLLNSIRESPLISECIVLSTCNRTEIYACSDDVVKGDTYLRSLLNDVKTVEYFSDQSLTYVHTDLFAIKHLFSVAAGLDSQILGEPQILGQVKDAYFMAFESKTTGVLLNKLFHFAFQVGKEVRNKTDLGYGKNSVGTVAVDYIRKHFSDISDKTALLIGAGEMGRIVAQYLQKKGIEKTYITNRTFERAKTLAEQIGGTPTPTYQLPQIIPEVDIIISATNAQGYILTPGMLNSNGHSLLLVDIAMPRSIDPQLENQKNIHLLSMDHFTSQIQQDFDIRKSAVPEAEATVEQYVEKAKKWLENVELTTIIKLLRERFEDTRNHVLSTNKKRFKQDDWEQIDLLTNSLVKQLLHIPLQQIKSFNNDPHHGLMKLETVFELFELEDLSGNSN